MNRGVSLKLLVVLFLMLLPGDIGHGQTKQVEHSRTTIFSTRLQLTAEAEPVGDKPDAAIAIKVRLRNVSAKPVRLRDSEPILNYRVTVVDRFGNEPPRTEFGKKLLSGEIAVLRNTVFDLAPGKEEDAILDITKIFRLTQPGTYSARVNRLGIWTEKDEDDDKFVEAVYSNPVQFTITP